MPRLVRSGLLALYCSAIYLVLDFAYSSLLFNDDKRPPRIAHPIYHHSFSPNFDGFDLWGENRHKLYTNDLGFKDIAVREVPLQPTTRRIVLIGDSFTEAIGLAFDDSFPGMLYRAGQAHTPKVEFLNAGVGSYSPTIYYAKINYLLAQGLRFDELVVLPDMSDVFDAAGKYFCIDENPVYRARCNPADVYTEQRKTTLGPTLQRKFLVTDTLRQMVKFRLYMWFGGKEDNLEHSRLDGWALPGWNPRRDFEPLGIEGGIARSLEHMRALADLLKKHEIALTVAVYPYPAQVNHEVRSSRQIELYRDFCAQYCRRFINLFPAVFAAKEAHPSDWYPRYFIVGDIHYSAEGNRVLFEELKKHLL